jgi:hypothetical protein
MISVGTDVYVGGVFTSAGGVPANRIARYDTQTEIWHALGDGVNGSVRSMVFVGTDVYVGGRFTRAGNKPASMFARWSGPELDDDPTNIPAIELPVGIKLSQNYPNPFNPTTQIEYALPEASHVRLEVYNLMGQRIATLVNEQQVAGNHRVIFDATNLSSGMYIYRITAGNFVETRKMLLVQ